MRRTGKLYTLTLISAVFTIYSSLSIASWTPDTANYHLWVDIIPQGFGMASLITTTLIVSSLFRRGLIALILTASKAMIAGVYKEDMAVATGSKSGDLRTAHITLIEFHSYIFIQDDWPSSWGKPERYCSSSRLARKIKRAHPRSWISPGERLRCGFILGSMLTRVHGDHRTNKVRRAMPYSKARSVTSPNELSLQTFYSHHTAARALAEARRNRLLRRCASCCFHMPGRDQFPWVSCLPPHSRKCVTVSVSCSGCAVV